MISIPQFYNVTSGILDEIVTGKTEDNDKKLNFEQSISYTPDPVTLESAICFCLPKQILRKPCFFNKMTMVNNHKCNRTFDNRNIWCSPIV